LPQQIGIVVVTISLVTATTAIVVTTNHIVDVTTEIVTDAILVCLGYINKKFVEATT